VKEKVSVRRAGESHGLIISTLRTWEKAEQSAMEENGAAVLEEELAHESYNVRLWCAYVDSKPKTKTSERFQAFERALARVPGSYKVRCGPQDSISGACLSPFWLR